MIDIINYMFFILIPTTIVYMWLSILRDLAQIRAAQKIECESIARLAKLLDEDRKQDEVNFYEESEDVAED